MRRPEPPDPSAPTHVGRVQQEFSRQAGSLERAAVFTDAAVLERIRGALRPAPDARVIDVGCGPGLVATDLASRAASITAVDLTLRMLTRARERAVASGLRNVHPVLADGARLPLAPESFDGAVSRLALHHAPDPEALLREMVRVLRPGGRVAIVEIVASEMPEEARLHNALEALRDPSHVRMGSRTELLRWVRSAGLRVRREVAWQRVRSFAEWAAIVDRSERTAPLRRVMLALARRGVGAGIDLREGETDLSFVHHFLLVSAERPPAPRS